MALPCESLLLRLNILHDETGPMAKALGLRVKFKLVYTTYAVAGLQSASPRSIPILVASSQRNV